MACCVPFCQSCMAMESMEEIWGVWLGDATGCVVRVRDVDQGHPNKMVGWIFFGRFFFDCTLPDTNIAPTRKRTPKKLL